MAPSSFFFLPFHSPNIKYGKVRNWKLLHPYSGPPQIWQINDPLKQRERGTSTNPIFQKFLFSIFLWFVSDYLGFLEASCDFVSEQNKGDPDRKMATTNCTDWKPPVGHTIVCLAADSYNRVESSLCSRIQAYLSKPNAKCLT